MGVGCCRVPRLCLALLVLSGWALHEGHGWRSKQEYVYRLEGRTVTSFLSLDTRGVGVHYLATVRVQAASDTVLLLRMEDAKYAKVQEDMPDSWWRHVQEPADQWESFPITDTTIVVTHEEGVAKKVAYSRDLQEWEVNFIQGVVGHLQANLVRGGDIFPHQDNSHGRKRRVSDTSVYKVMENGVAGRCEVLYEVARVSKAQAALGSDWPDNTHVCGDRSLLEITKTTNYSNCQHSAEYHVGLPRSAANCNAGSSLCGDFWQRVFVTRMRGCGDQKDFTVLDSVGTSRQLANLHLHEDSGSAINSYLNLSLVSAEQVERFLPTVSSPNVQKNLLYLYRPQELEERHARAARAATRHRQRHYEVPRSRPPVQPDAASSEEEGSPEPAALPPPDASNPQQLQYCPQFLSRRSPDARPQLVENFRRLMHEVAAEMDDPQLLKPRMSLEKLESAVVICRSMTRSELEAAAGEVLGYPEGRSDTERKLVMDAVVMCGTNPAFSFLKELVESEKIKGESAADVISTLPHHISAPTISLLDDFSSLMTSPAVKKDQQLLISAALAFSNLVRSACASPTSKKAFYTSEVFRADACSSRSAERYLRQLVTLTKQHPGLQSVMLTALGNTGLPSALPLLASVASGDSSAYIRSMAVFSMRHHALLHPGSTAPVLLGIFQRPENPVAVRMAAVALLWHASPQLSVWQRIAVATWYERDPALVAFVVSCLESFARVDNPAWEPMRKNAQAALKLAKPIPSGLERAYNVIWSSVSEELDAMVQRQFEWIYNFKFSTWYYHSTSRLGGFPWFNAEVEMDLANPDAFLTSLRQLVVPPDDSLLARPPLRDIPRSTADIARSLNMALKSAPGLEGALRFKMADLAERMLPFGKKLQSDLAKAGRNVLSQLKQGKSFHFQKVGMKMLMIETTTEMGFPISFKMSMPCASRLSGVAKVAPDGAHVAFDASAFHARHLIAELMVYTPWDHALHVAGSQGCAVVIPPALRMNARLDAPAGLLQLEVKPSGRAPGGGSAHYRSMPYVAQRDARGTPLDGDRTVIRVDHPKKLEYRGRELSFNYESDDPRGFWDLRENSVSVLGFPMLPDLRAIFVDLQLAELPAVVASFGLGRAKASRGEVEVTSAPWQSREWPSDILGGQDGPELTMMMADTTEEGYDEGTTPDFSAWPEPQEGSTTSEATPESMEEVASRYGMWGGGSESGSDECPDEDPEKLWGQLRRPDFVAAELDPFAPSVNGTVYLLRESLKDFYHGNAFVASANVSVYSLNMRNYTAFLVHAVRPFSLERKIGLFVKELASDWQFTLGLYNQAPMMPFFSVDEEALSSLSSFLYADVGMRATNTKYTASFWGKAAHKEGTPAAIVEAWKQQGCQVEGCGEIPLFNPKCKDIMYNATSYDLFAATLTYNEEVKEALPEDSSWHEDATGVLDQYLMEESERRKSSANQMDVVAYVADDGRTMDVVLRYPGRTRAYRDLPAPFAFDERLAQVPLRSVYSQPTCILGKNRIATYDGVEYEYGLNNCWHVATMDCSGKSKVAILARRNGDELEVEVNADNFKVLTVLAGPRVLVDGEQLDLVTTNVTRVEDDMGGVVAELALGPDDSLALHLPAHGLRLLYDKSAAVVQSTPGLEGRTCGLCGDQDGELADEFTGPSGQVLASAGDFARSFLLQDSECTADQESRRVC